MRFGKWLTEVTDNDGTNQPYISYKELKRIIGELVRLAADKTGVDNGGCVSGPAEGDSFDSAAAAMGRDAMPLSSTCHSAAASSNCSGLPRVFSPDMEARQHDFFRTVHTDVTRCVSHVRAIVASTEVAIGEWQTAAVVAGFLFTPEQLDELSQCLTFEVKDKHLLAEWLINLQPAVSTCVAQQGLISQYAKIANTVGALLQYIEVNITAVRKILKKIEKKIPAEVRVQNAQDYKGHHELVGTATLELLATVGSMRRLVAGITISTTGMDATACLPSLFVGEETISLLSSLPGPSIDLTDFVGRSDLCEVDVYAPPTCDITAGMSRSSQAGSIPKTATVRARDSMRAIDEARVQDSAHVADPAARQAISEKAVCAVRLADLLDGPPSRREARDTRSVALGSSKNFHPSCAVTTQPAGTLRNTVGGVMRSRGGRRRGGRGGGRGSHNGYHAGRASTTLLIDSASRGDFNRERSSLL